MAQRRCLGLFLALARHSTEVLGALRGQHFPLQVPAPSAQEVYPPAQIAQPVAPPPARLSPDGPGTAGDALAAATAVAASQVPRGSEQAAAVMQSACQFCALRIDAGGCAALAAGTNFLAVTPAGCERCQLSMVAECRQRAQLSGWPQPLSQPKNWQPLTWDDGFGVSAAPAPTGLDCKQCAADFASAGGCDEEQLDLDSSSYVSTACRVCGDSNFANCPTAPLAMYTCARCNSIFVSKGGCPILAEFGYWDTEPYVPLGCEPCSGTFASLCASPTRPAPESNETADNETSTTPWAWGAPDFFNDTDNDTDNATDNFTENVSSEAVNDSETTLAPPSENHTEAENASISDGTTPWPLWPPFATESDAGSTTSAATLGTLSWTTAEGLPANDSLSTSTTPAIASTENATENETVTSTTYEAVASTTTDVVITENETAASTTSDIVSTGNETVASTTAYTVSTENETAASTTNDIVSTESETAASTTNDIVSTENETAASISNDIVSTENETDEIDEMDESTRNDTEIADLFMPNPPLAGLDKFTFDAGATSST